MYYEQKRQRFLSLLTQQYQGQMKLTDKEIKKRISEILLITGDKELSNTSKEDAEKLLTTAHTAVMSYIENSPAVKKTINNFLSSIPNPKTNQNSLVQVQWQKTKEKYSTIKTENNQIVSNLNEQGYLIKNRETARTEFTKKMVDLIKKQEFGQNLIKQIGDLIISNYTNKKISQNENIMAQVINYSIRVILSMFIDKVTGDIMIKEAVGRYKNTIGGYLKEDAIVDLMNKENLNELNNFLQTNLESLITGYGAANQPEDFLFLVGKSSIDNKFMKFDDATKLIENSKEYYGGQVKSWSLKDIELQKGHELYRDYFPIGSRSSLFKTFEGWYYSQFNDPQQFHMAGNMAFFLNNKEAIIEALGANNIMFVDGSTRRWMSNFITEFRKNKLYLQFDMVNDGDREEKIPSPHVALYLYKNQTYKVLMDKLTK